eukprot:2505966-Ditylum_brightwellii.AAC.1
MGHVFAAPAHPGSNPPNPRAFLLQHDLHAQQDCYYAELNAFAIYRNTDKALTEQILASFDGREDSIVNVSPCILSKDSTSTMQIEEIVEK